MTTVVGLITDNDETAYREEVRELEVWCQDYWKRQAKQAPININGAVVAQVKSFKFLSVNIINELSWANPTKTVVKRPRQYLSPLG